MLTTEGRHKNYRGQYDCNTTSLVGEVLDEVRQCGDDELQFIQGKLVVRFYHRQDCCETVEITSVCGDFSNLVGVPIIVAECREVQADTSFGSKTSTFYTFRTSKGDVDVHWQGESNGHYSESVDVCLEKRR